MVKRYTVSLVLAAALLLALLSAASADPWPLFRQNPQRTGQLSGVLEGADVGPVWYFHTDNKVIDCNSAVTTGTWASHLMPEQYRTDCLLADTATTSTATCTWTFDFRDYGFHSDQALGGWAAYYRVYAWLPFYGSRKLSPDARYTITVNRASGAVQTYVAVVDQHTNAHGDWIQLQTTADIPIWASSTPYKVGDMVEPTTSNGHVYLCITAGTSGAGEPSWPTASGETVDDGGVVWQEYSSDYADLTIRAGDTVSISLSNLSSETGAVAVASAVKMERQSAVAGSVVTGGDTASPTGENKTLLTSVTELVGTSYAGEQDFQLTKGVVYSLGTEEVSGVDTTGPVWRANTGYVVGQYVRPAVPNGHVYLCTRAGTSGASEPAWPGPDGTVHWEPITDDRGLIKWQFPADPGQWIGGDLTSTPAIFSALGVPGVANGTEVAVVAAGDGQVYAIDTADGSLIWRGPGWVKSPDQYNSVGSPWVNGGHAGYQDAGYKHVQAVTSAASDAARETGSTAVWNFSSLSISKSRSYTLYAWIPKSSQTERYVPDARYTISVNGWAVPSRLNIDQTAGGRWISLLTIDKASVSSSLSVTVTLYGTTTLSDTANRFVAADAMKLVPADLGVFDSSSPVVTQQGAVYVASTSGSIYRLQIDGGTNHQEPVWTYPLDYPAAEVASLGLLYSSPALSADGNTLYQGTDSGHVVAVNTVDGTRKWDYFGENVSDPDPAEWRTLGRIWSTTAVADNTIYVGVGGQHPTIPLGKEIIGKVIALRDNGSGASLVWEYPNGETDASWPENADNNASVGNFTYSSPLLMTLNGDTAPSIFMGSTDGYFYAINAATGRGFKSGDGVLDSTRRWLGKGSVPADKTTWKPHYPDYGAPINSSPAGTQAGGVDVAFFGSDSGGIYEIDLASGLPISSHGVSSSTMLYGPVYASPALYDGRVYIGDMQGYTWALSSRTTEGAQGSGDMKWNTATVPQAPPAARPNPHSTVWSRVARPDVDIFTKEEFDQLRSEIASHQNGEAMGGSAMDPNLHRFSTHLRDGTGNPIRYEWGDSMYFVVWNLLSPNYDKTTGDEVTEPSLSTFVKTSASTVTLAFKSRAPGDGADVSETQTLVDKGYFIGWNEPWKASTTYSLGQYVTPSTRNTHRYKVAAIDGDTVVSSGASGATEPSWPTDSKETVVDGHITWEEAGTDKVPIFYARYIYNLGLPTRSRPQVPGSRITATVQETSRTTSGDSGGSVMLPEKTNVTRDKYTPLYLAINNPLGIWMPRSVGIGRGIGVDDTGGGGTSLTAYLADVNGNADAARERPSRYPYLQTGDSGHGTSSPSGVFAVFDRSRLYKQNLSLQRFRIERHDLQWQGGPDQAVAPIWKWEVKPPPAYQNLPNTSPDYPDIPSNRLACLMAGSGTDPAQWAVSLLPGSGTDPSSWTAGKNEVSAYVNVPRFQPANSNAAHNPYLGYAGRIFAYIDTNGNGRLDLPGIQGAGGMIRRAVSGARAETYREFAMQADVVSDPRMQIQEKTLDFGQVPQGHGIIRAVQGMPYTLFWPTIAENYVNAWDPGSWEAGSIRTPGFRDWFKPFTAYNYGNVNLRNITVQRSHMLSDNVQDPTFALTSPAQPWSSDAALVGNWLAGNYLTSTLDARFLSDPRYADKSELSARTLHKARVGETAPQLLVADAPLRMYEVFGFTSNGAKVEWVYPRSPALSVAVPIGTPAGTYYGTFWLRNEESFPHFNPAYPSATTTSNFAYNVVTVTEARLTNGATAGSAPHIDAGSSGSAGNISPAVYKDANQSIYLFWPSNRKPDGAAPVGTDPWYLQTSRLTRDATGKWVFGMPFNGTSLLANAWWTTPAQFPSSASLGDLFPGSPLGTPGSLLTNTVRFSSPSVTTDSSDDAWLFFMGQAYKDPGMAGVPYGSQESRIYYTNVKNGNLNNAIRMVTTDWTMPKYGIRAMALDMNPGPKKTLWCFWYGGSNDKWRIYYTMNPDSSTPNAPWIRELQLQIPKGLTSVAQPCPVYKDQIGDLHGVIDVIYSGYSSYHKNSDIYLSRYRWDGSKLALQSLTQMTEQLVRSATEAVWNSRDLDWKNDEPGDIDIRVNEVSITAGQQYQTDPTTGARVYTYPEQSNPFRALYRALIVDPTSGTVRFMRTPGKSARISAIYTPRAERLTTDPSSDVSPIAFWDSGVFDGTEFANPRYMLNPQTGNGRFFFPSGKATPTTDRLWVFWRRPGVDKPGTGIHYKAFRYSVDLDPANPVQKPVATTASPVTVGGSPAKPVEIDWIKNRLYFMSEDAGKTVTVSYRRASDGGTVNWPDTDHAPLVVSLQEETGLGGGSTFGNLTRVMVNEGQVAAFKDPDYNKVWVFWTSTRAGSTDIYFETISPRFYGVEY